MEQKSKSLKTIEQEKVQPSTPSPMTATSAGMDEYEKLNSMPPNHVLNVIRALKEKQAQRSIWFSYELPSNGKCGYPKEIQIREMTTEDEKILIKEMFSSRENSILNLIKKCVRFENQPDFDFENLVIFDQDFILLELSAITFPGEKEITITDEAGHKITTKLDKSDLAINKVPDNLVYPFKVLLPSSNLTWYLNFMTLKNIREIDKATKSLSQDILTRLLVSISQTTERVEMNGQEIKFDNFYEVVKLLDSIPTPDLKVLIDFYNDKTAGAYGYKLEKEYSCIECRKDGKMELEPLSFFRLTL